MNSAKILNDINFKNPHEFVHSMPNAIATNKYRNNGCVPDNEITTKPYRTEIVWKNAIGFAMIHVTGLYGVHLVFTSAFLATLLWGVFVVYLCQLGVSVGAHRLFTHRTFEAKTPLKLFLLICHTIAAQNCTYVWVRDHRQHHKYSDTNADPHNSTRGFFFSHIGWLMVRKHPDVIKFGETIDMSDIEADPYIMFQKKYYKRLYFLLALLFPMAVPCYFWNETLWNSFMITHMLRNIFVLNGTWLVNSAAHLYGTRPYDKNIQPVEVRFVSWFTGGEGWHNFHHTYPWDYRAAEFGPRFNTNEVFIEICEKLGLASNLRSVSKSVVMKKVLKTGDGSHPVWGYGDKDMDRATKKMITSTCDAAEFDYSWHDLDLLDLLSELRIRIYEYLFNLNKKSRQVKLC